VVLMMLVQKVPAGKPCGFEDCKAAAEIGVVIPMMDKARITYLCDACTTEFMAEMQRREPAS